mmetsp:Transcript_42333/g.70662  ORF Transcript_42333/g.70662 Transcript_42333/m.70662 type:complete len:222 (+) Transcript_42333:855-1520(+)
MKRFERTFHMIQSWVSALPFSTFWTGLTTSFVQRSCSPGCQLFGPFSLNAMSNALWLAPLFSTRTVVFSPTHFSYPLGVSRLNRQTASCWSTITPVLDSFTIGDRPTSAQVFHCFIFRSFDGLMVRGGTSWLLRIVWNSVSLLPLHFVHAPLVDTVMHFGGFMSRCMPGNSAAAFRTVSKSCIPLQLPSVLVAIRQSRRASSAGVIFTFFLRFSFAFLQMK